MSHFTVLVVGHPDKLDEQMIPFQEHACTGKCPKEYMEFEDCEEEERKEYETGSTEEFYDSSSSSWGMVCSEQMYAPIANAKIGDIISITFERNELGMATYFQQGRYYKCGVSKGNNECPSEQTWVKVIKIVETSHPDKDVAFEGTIKVRIVDPPREIPFKSKYPSFEDYMEEYCGYKERDPEMNRYGRWENPNAKWDWYEIGGRWAGHFLIKPEFHHLYMGTTPNFSWGWKEKQKEEVMGQCVVDSAMKKHIDIEKMMKDVEDKAGQRYALAMTCIFKDIPINETWDVVRESIEDVEDARKKYWAQPRCVAWKAYDEKLRNERKNGVDNSPITNLLDVAFGSPDEFAMSHKEYIGNARRQAISTFAFLRNGHWAEKGKMGWFAMVSNENDSWPDIFTKLFNDIPDDEWVSVVDCHI
jgi:hypothetical protein